MEGQTEIVTFVVDTTGNADNQQNETSSEAFDIKLPKDKKKKRGQRIEYTVKDKLQEKELEGFVFNDFQDFKHFGQESKQEETSEESEKQTKELQPAWKDEDDEKETVDISSVSRLKKLRKTEKESTISGEEYSQRLRSHFDKIKKQSVEWAQIPDQEEELENEILRTTAKLIKNGGSSLQPHGINIMRVKDANAAEYSETSVNAIGFHPNAQLFFTASFDGKLRLFQIDGTNNPKVQSIFFQKYSINGAHFTPDGNEILMHSSRTNMLHIYDVRTSEIQKLVRPQLGKKGYSTSCISPDGQYIALFSPSGITLLSGKSKQIITQLKSGTEFVSGSFSPDSSTLYTTGANGEIFLWDMNSRTCSYKFLDEGSLKSTAITVSKNGKYLVSGSESGIVNVYNNEEAKESKKPTLIKELPHLTTQVTALAFNHDSQILALASKEKRDSLKLVHVPSFTVFANWPTQRTPVGFMNSFAFSPNSGYFAFGTHNGKVLLYKLLHYEKA